MESLDVVRARRLALASAGLLKPEWNGLPKASVPAGGTRDAGHRLIGHFGYLQLDAVAVAGARSHALVLHSRLAHFNPSVAEEFLAPRSPLFEYWGHEVSWMPLELYPLFAFRRRQFKTHPWWGDVVAANPSVARDIKRRLAKEGPLRTVDLEGTRVGQGGWWNGKVATRVAAALWSMGELAVRERKNFQRTWDLADRVIPAEWRGKRAPALKDALGQLLLKALAGHGWATTGTLARTWRLVGMQAEVARALEHLVGSGEVTPCCLETAGGRRVKGWVRPQDLELAERLHALRVDDAAPVLLSPFDPLLWDRARVKELFGFSHALEIYKPAAKRTHGYYVLPVLAGEHLVGRLDLKAEKPQRLHVLSCHLEHGFPSERHAAQEALDRFAAALHLEPGSCGVGRSFP